MKRVKIVGAGSIGNHLTHAARQLGCSVDLCDLDQSALVRAKNMIYPERYGQWDDEIGLYSSADVPVGGYDLICIGTPPDSHLDLAIKALEEAPKALLIEKPICGPDLARAQELFELAAAGNTEVFTGYDHVIGKVAVKTRELTESTLLGEIETIDVEFREHWGGIFAAHSWLDGPAASYLGDWRRGGGALGEHSHAVNLWQHFALVAGAGRVHEVSAIADYIEGEGVFYDKVCALNLRTETGLVGRVVQDVVTLPPRKWGRIQGSDGYLDWQFGYEPGRDKVGWSANGDTPQDFIAEKTRPDDFIAVLEHIRDVLEGRIKASPIALERGLETMLVIAAAHKSAQTGRTIKIDYEQGYCSAALQ
jgi:predicted dehydrogenase